RSLGFARGRLARLRDHGGAHISHNEIRPRPRPRLHARQRGGRDGAGAPAGGMMGAGRTGAEGVEPHRRHLTGLAYRMLGSLAEAEDAVQEAYLRWHGTDHGKVQDARAFLSKTVARLCLDQLKSARVRRETYVGPWLPEPLLEEA